MPRTGQDRTNSELPRPWDRTGGRKHSAKTSDWRGGGPFSPRGRCGNAPCPGELGSARWAPPVRTPRPLLPSPSALADLAGAGALHSEARGGAGPPHTAALRHESPPSARDQGQGRGAHFLYLAGLDPILSRGGLQSPTPSPFTSLIP